MKQITGTWRLVTTRAKNDAGEVMHAPYGPKPMGLAAFDSYGRMIAVLCDGRTTLSVGEVDREFNAIRLTAIRFPLWSMPLRI